MLLNVIDRHIGTLLYVIMLTVTIIQSILIYADMVFWLIRTRNGDSMRHRHIRTNTCRYNNMLSANTEYDVNKVGVIVVCVVIMHQNGKY